MRRAPLQAAALLLLLALLACCSFTLAHAQVHAAPAPAPQARVSQLRAQLTGVANVWRVSGKLEFSTDGGASYFTKALTSVLLSFTNNQRWVPCCNPAGTCCSDTTTGCPCRSGDGGGRAALPGGWEHSSTSTSSSDGSGPSPGRAAVTFSLVFTDAAGAFEAWFVQRRPGGGPSVVTIPTAYLDYPVAPPTTPGYTPSFIGPSSVLLGIGQPASVALAPHKARAHVGAHVELVARLADAGGAPAAGVPVAFEAAGDCRPRVAWSHATSGADGLARVTVSSGAPGVVAVVAAARSAAGGVVVSQPSHITFSQEPHHHIHDSREDADDQEHNDHRYHALAEEAASLASAAVTAMPTH